MRKKAAGGDFMNFPNPILFPEGEGKIGVMGYAHRTNPTTSTFELQGRRRAGRMPAPQNTLTLTLFRREREVRVVLSVSIKIGYRSLYRVAG